MAPTSTPNLPPGWTAVPTTATSARNSQPNRAYYTTIADPNNPGQNLKLYVTTNLQNNITQYTYYNSKNQPIFSKIQNGNIQIPPGSPLTKQQQQNLINNANQQTNTLSNSLGGNTNNTVIGGGPATPIAPGIFDNPLKNFTDVATTLTKGDNILKKFKLLKYPEDLLDNGQDTLLITQFRYNPPRRGVFEPDSNVFTNGIVRKSSVLLKEPILKVILPAPNNASDSNNVGWGPDNMNNLTAAAAGAVLNNMGAGAGAAGLGGALGALTSALTGGNPLSGGASGASTAIKMALYSKLITEATSSGSANASSLLGTGVASQALNMAGFEVSPESILASGAGVIPNSNLELLFNAPTLREFTFEYRLSPRSRNEATIVRNIIRSFKQGMAPRKVNAGSGTGPGGYFLATPNVFKLQYQTADGKSIQGVNRIKICALTGFSANYTPDGQWAAYEGGQPVSYIIKMSFNELDPVYENDYYSDDNPARDVDLEPIAETDDIGY